MAKVLIIGGHGKVALLLAPLLVAAGDEVTSVIRDPAHSDEVAATGATPVAADVQALDVAGLTSLLAGQDAVVWSAGAAGREPWPDTTYAVDRDAAIRSMDAASAAAARRYVMVSYFGAGKDHGVPADQRFFPYAEAKAAADDHLRGSRLDWTILGPSGLTLDPPTGRIETAAQGATSGQVGRADVAAVIAAVLHDPATIGRTINFNNGETPIADAIAR
ncbi:NAD(P)H-binding protein [Actinoplanes sp. NPDC051470]|uniref:NAD(P)H-binding protein n=1 Tax=Actinoplanes sp. NPDC051470 TaxID=3157224 RepID=UPI00341BD039